MMGTDGDERADLQQQINDLNEQMRTNRLDNDALVARADAANARR